MRNDCARRGRVWAQMCAPSARTYTHFVAHPRASSAVCQPGGKRGRVLPSPSPPPPPPPPPPSPSPWPPPPPSPPSPPPMPIRFDGRLLARLPLPFPIREPRECRGRRAQQIPKLLWQTGRGTSAREHNRMNFSEYRSQRRLLQADGMRVMCEFAMAQTQISTVCALTTRGCVTREADFTTTPPRVPSCTATARLLRPRTTAYAHPHTRPTFGGA